MFISRSKIISYLVLPLVLLGGCKPKRKGIGTWEREKNVGALVKALEDIRSPHRSQAAHSLGAIGDPEAVGPLLGVLNGKNRPLQMAAVEALGEIGDKKAVDPLIALLRDGYSGLTGTPAPGRGGPPSRGGREQSSETFDTYQQNVLLRAQLRKKTIIALGQIGDRRAADIIAGAIWDGRSDEVSRAATETMAQMGGEGGEKTFLDAFGTCNFLIRQIAAQALADIQPPPIRALSKTLDDENPCLREGAAQAIGLIGETDGVERLVRMLADESYGVQLQASTALARIGEEAVPVLTEALEDDNATIRKWACRILGIINDPHSIYPILRVMGDEELQVRKAAASVLHEVDKKIPTPLFFQLGKLPFANSEEKIIIIKTIALAKAPHSLFALKAEARNPDAGVSQAATDALEAIPDQP